MCNFKFLNIYNKIVKVNFLFFGIKTPILNLSQERFISQKLYF